MLQRNFRWPTSSCFHVQCEFCEESLEEVEYFGLDDYKEYIPKFLSLKNIRRFFLAIIFLLGKLFSEVFPFECICIDTIEH